MNPLYRVMAMQCLIIGDAFSGGDQVVAVMIASLLLGCLTVQVMGV